MIVQSRGTGGKGAPIESDQGIRSLRWDKRTQLAVAVSFALGAALRVLLSVTDDGIYWPDEIYQSLEPAHHLLFGYGLMPWEYVEGARTWVFPGLIAGLIKAWTLPFGDAPHGYLLALRIAFSLLNLFTAVGVAKLARAAGARPGAAALGSVLFVLAPPEIYFAPRALSEAPSAAVVAWGLALLFGQRRNAWGWSLLGLSPMLRVQNGVFCAGALLILLARKEWRAAARGAGVLGLWALVLGAFDRITWGGWFHSSIDYLRFTLVEGKSDDWGVAPPTFYLRVLWTSMPLITLVCAPLVLAAVRKATWLWALAGMFVALHSATGHKEYRFILPVLPALFALAAVGFDVCVDRLAVDARWLAAGITALALVSALRFRSLTFGDLGKEHTNDSAYDDFGSVNRLLLVARDQPGLCGLAVDGSLSWTGGYAYFHRRVPLYALGKAGSGHFNYAIVRGARKRRVLHARPGQRIVARDGTFNLVALPDRCTPDPDFRWRL